MKVAVFLPCYNSENQLPLKNFSDYIEQKTSYDFYFLDDGSTDNTAQLITDFSKNYENVFAVIYQKNQGKAEVIRKSFLQLYQKEKNAYQFFAFLDSDLDIPLEELDAAIEIAKNQHFLMITGLRLRRLGSEYKRTQTRHFLSRIFATFSAVSLGVPVYDTQCGMKVYDISLIPILFNEKFMSKWLFDVEVLHRFIHHFSKEIALTKIYEMPLHLFNNSFEGTSIKPQAFLKAPLELVKMYWKYR